MNEQKRTQENKKKLIEALEKSLGIVTEACDKASLSRTQFYKWYKEDEHFKKQVDNIEGKFIDFAETHLKKQIENDNTQATIFYLKTRGRRRGYGDSLDITSGDEPITINVKIKGVEY
jgi:predicted DNA-binding transcriptional regulator AlpA